jgi:hypothetical protein
MKVILPPALSKNAHAISVGTDIGTCRGDQFVRRKVSVSKKSNKPVIRRAYPTHLLAGIAIIH